MVCPIDACGVGAQDRESDLPRDQRETVRRVPSGGALEPVRDRRRFRPAFGNAGPGGALPDTRQDRSDLRLRSITEKAFPMKLRFRTLASAAAISAALCVSTASFAQMQPAAPAMASADARHDGGPDRMREHVEAMGRALHDILNLRPDQDGALRDFMATMQPPEGPDRMTMHHDEDRMDRMTTPERLDRMAARLADKQAEFQRHADAVRRFYAALSPDQQRAFDAVQGMMMMDGHHHGMGGGPMGEHHGHGDDRDD
jgi:hypothetical protein